ncbi:RHOMBOID-like protein 2 isoform X2 [Phragmites australis]|uniref:RHOMBOID-like protein 2 isoform X2 n=1 Tax=Phragmites australis TaxID=29695 RepID=UPI002D79A56E|nr:RHOMBOID-like protein 2 isoform X2 [Phragmites australis]
MKPDEDVQVLVERPTPQGTLRARPYNRRWSPWIVSAATVACIVVFLVTMYVNDCPGRSNNCTARFLGRFAFQPLRENPLLGPSSATLLKMGALDVSKVVHGRQGWRLITCMWLHAGVVHLLINMLGLLFIGIRLEQEFGFVRVGLVYLVSGLGGSLMSALFIRSSISVGASGALFGLIGSMLSELITNWSLYANKVSALLTLVLMIVVNLALGILPRVDNFAHIGGLISGFFLGFVIFIRPQVAWLNQRRGTPGQQTSPVKRKHKTYQYILWLAAAIALIVGFAVATVLLFRGYNANEHCSWCHYLSCVPTKRWKCNSSPTLCTEIQRENTLNLICEGTNKNATYIIGDPTQDKINDLCNQLCS